MKQSSLGTMFGIAAIGLGSCTTSGGTVAVVAQATGSPYFSLSQPAAYKAGDGLQFAGRVCRRARGTLLSPPRVRLEHVAAAGNLIEVTHADIPEIYRNADQACADYTARVTWQIGEGDSVRACFDRGRACPADAATKAVIAIPVVAPQ